MITDFSGVEMQQGFDSAGVLARAGLNLQAVFDLDVLPADMRESFAHAARHEGAYRQLILLGHGGGTLWRRLQERGAGGDDPIDSFSREIAGAYLEGSPACADFTFLYPPSENPVPLISLGMLAGWHHTSLFRVGINADWGSWFAYRALILADSQFTPVARKPDASPCDSCTEKPCMAACPVGAVTEQGLIAEKCFDHRLAASSSCAQTCLARLACPVASDRRYGPEQMRYHYERSLNSLQAYREQGLV